MKTQLNLRNAALVAALGAVAATAWATNEYVANDYAEVEKDAVVAQGEPMAPPAEPAMPNETVTTSEPAIAPVPAPVVERSVAQPPLTVEDRRLTLDQRIQANVIDVLAQAPNISGKIGVESQDAVVTLTGYTVTAGQAYRAGRHAGSVEGVKTVRNEIRPRIGGSV